MNTQDTNTAVFFEPLAEMQKNVTLTIVVSIGESSDDLTVSILPKFDKEGDKALQLIKPMNFNASAKALDQAFLKMIAEPIQKAMELKSNTVEYMQQIKIAEAQTKEKKDLKAKIDKVVKALKDYTEQKDFEYVGKMKSKAVRLAQDVIDLDNENKLALTVIADANKAASENTLFQ